MSDTLSSLDLRIVTPLGLFYEGEAYMAIFQTDSGELGVLPGHIPLTATLSSTIFYMKENPEAPEQKFSIHGGFVRVEPESITVVTQAAEWPEDINVERAQAAKERAEQRLTEAHSENTDVARAEYALKRALVRLELAGH